MNNEIGKMNEEKILLSLNNQIKLHLILNDGSWRNGYVRELKTDFFMFVDDVNGVEPIFFLDLIKAEPFMEAEK